MKKLLLLSSIVALFSMTSCTKNTGELLGVQRRAEWFDIDPFGMLYTDSRRISSVSEYGSGSRSSSSESSDESSDESSHM